MKHIFLHSADPEPSQAEMKVVSAYLLAVLGGKTTTSGGGGAVAVATTSCGGGAAAALAAAEAKKEDKQIMISGEKKRKGKKWVRLSQHKNQTNLQYETKQQPINLHQNFRFPPWNLL